jgi:hypothetical protein
MISPLALLNGRLFYVHIWVLLLDAGLEAKVADICS